MQHVYRYIDDHSQEAIDRLMRLCRQPSVSAQQIGLHEMARLLEDEMRAVGIPARQLPTKTGVPMVYGEIRVEGARRTLLFYNHYDVQPVEPLDEWVTPPFEPTIRDGRVYARGATDNKGNIVSRLTAIKALLDQRGGPPVNVKFIVEGQEEISSPGLPAFLEEHRDLLEADGCVWEDTMGRIDAPVVSLGSKGMCYVELSCKVASVDSHSAYAGIYPNAIWRLVWALSAIKGPDERVRIPGFYDDVRPLDAAESQIVDQLPPIDGEGLKRVRGLRRLVGDLEDAQIHRRQTLEPTCNISGIVSGYHGKGTKTVIPAEAIARMDFRLVPDQDPEKIVALLRAHLSREGFDDVDVVLLGESHPSRSPVDTPLNRAIATASQSVYGKPPIFEPHQAGSTPQWVVGRYLGMPCSATGVGYVTCMSHAPNENVRIDHLIDGAKYMAAIMDAFADA
ncbi:MAG TPA: M20/M25/M40 family metallo-hydrolase [Candidatus Dormibacteraeota bacterium]|nr:M20/M25/M40 family metallo-hydrolase [Candidatus Dormibacteraeota bacterium]